MSLRPLILHPLVKGVHFVQSGTRVVKRARLGQNLYDVCETEHGFKHWQRSSVTTRILIPTRSSAHFRNTPMENVNNMTPSQPGTGFSRELGLSTRTNSCGLRKASNQAKRPQANCLFVSSTVWSWQESNTVRERQDVCWQRR